MLHESFSQFLSKIKSGERLMTNCFFLKLFFFSFKLSKNDLKTQILGCYYFFIIGCTRKFRNVLPDVKMKNCPDLLPVCGTGILSPEWVRRGRRVLQYNSCRGVRRILCGWNVNVLVCYFTSHHQDLHDIGFYLWKSF